ncbi:probable protein phosphatase 2C 42 [Cynara cardunculus var. scolymus]|uniref:protein-serine/threonine phosphatase n=1 Tax=Cynara cardunculus var. scolymus TaxID=59895 RepID=A0A103XZJ9_CYNCS|nr:probable protein phosphatase 2C 42 [Cynara cardunculus var. scolymus]KVH99764.1 Protein phosphatase 2C [Cynara cardunculus var. scolymus]
MLEGLMNLLSVCWKPFIKGDSSETGAAVGVNGNYNGDGDDFEKDGLLWFRDIGKYGSGEYSMAVVQANQVLEDQSQIESGSFGTFVGVYDGHGGPDVARYVCDNLFRNFQAISAEDYGVVTPETIRNTFLETENGFTAVVSELFNVRPSIATVGSCCLVGVIYQQTLFIANLGDSRVVLGKKVGNTGGMAAIQLSSEHNANLEEVRHELKSLHPHDPQIVALKHGVWRVKGIIQVSRSIGDVYMKHSEYNTDQIAPKFRLPEEVVMPILSATPSILTHAIQPSDSFLIFASDGLWEHLSNEEAVEIVHNNPRAGIAKRLVKAALHEAAKKREMRYSDLRKIDKRVRRHFHDDITVIVLFLNYDQISRGSANGPNVSVRSALEH